jgi:DNA-binding CsgD family transcriptional regulator/predicted ester cyclase
MSNFIEELTQNFVLPLWNQQNLDNIEKYIAPSADIHTTFIVGRGPKTMRESVEETFKAFPIFSVKVEEIIQQESKVTYKWLAEAEHKGVILNIQPTHKKMHFHGLVYGELDLENRLVTQYHSFSNIPQVLYAHVEQSNVEIFPTHGVLLDHENYEKETTDVLFTITKITGVRLTRRETQCLNFWLRGYSIKATAKQLGGLSVKTIQVFRDNIRKKFNVASFQELFNFTRQNGILSLFLGVNASSMPNVEIA